MIKDICTNGYQQIEEQTHYLIILCQIQFMLLLLLLLLAFICCNLVMRCCLLEPRIKLMPAAMSG
jgi:hypothetical protein